MKIHIKSLWKPDDETHEWAINSMDDVNKLAAHYPIIKHCIEKHDDWRDVLHDVVKQLSEHHQDAWLTVE